MRLVLMAVLAVILSFPAAAQQAEHPAVARLRALLPAPATLAYDSAAPLAADPAGVRLSGVTLTRRTETVRIAELELEGLVDNAITRLVARGFVQQDGNASVRIARLELERLRHTPRPGGGEPMPTDIAADALTIEGLEVIDTPRFAVRRITLRDYGAGRSGSVALEGLSVSGIEQSPVTGVALARFNLSGFDLAALMDAAMRQVTPPNPPAGRVTVGFQGLVLNAGTTVLGGADTLLVEADTLANMAGTARFALRGVTVENSPVTAAFLQAMDLPRLDASLTFDAAYEPTAGRLSMPALALGVRDLGAIALGLTLDGWTPQAAQRRDPTAMILRDARLRVVDEGAYGRAVRAQAQQMRATEDQVRQQHAQLLGQLMSAPNAPVGLNQLRDAVLGVVRRQARGVDIALQPPQPLRLETFGNAIQQGPAQAVRAMGLTAAPVR